jgi:outer membrane protein OmpA-like peptidoglycan-associated protein
MLACAQQPRNAVPSAPTTPDYDSGQVPSPAVDAPTEQAKEALDASQAVSDAESDADQLLDVAESGRPMGVSIYSSCEVWITAVIPFEKSTAKIVGMGFTTIVSVARFLKEYSIEEVELRAFDDPDDRRTKPWLAAERAKKVRKELLDSGIAAGRVRISKQVRVVKSGEQAGIEFAITKVAKGARCSIGKPR